MVLYGYLCDMPTQLFYMDAVDFMMFRKILSFHVRPRAARIRGTDLGTTRRDREPRTTPPPLPPRWRWPLPPLTRGKPRSNRRRWWGDNRAGLDWAPFRGQRQESPRTTRCAGKSPPGQSTAARPRWNSTSPPYFVGKINKSPFKESPIDSWTFEKGKIKKYPATPAVC